MSPATNGETSIPTGVLFGNGSSLLASICGGFSAVTNGPVPAAVAAPYHFAKYKPFPLLTVVYYVKLTVDVNVFVVGRTWFTTLYGDHSPLRLFAQQSSLVHEPSTTLEMHEIKNLLATIHRYSKNTINLSVTVRLQNCKDYCVTGLMHETWIC